MIRRNRILRQNDSIRKMVTETFLHPADFILPVFIVEGKGIKEPWPRGGQLSLDEVVIQNQFK